MSENTTYPQPTLFAAASLAKMSALQENKKVSKAKGQRSGQSSIVSFAKFAPDGSLLKMSQGFSQVTLEGSLQKFSETFPRAGIMQSGELYQPLVLEQTIFENECLLFPTPRASNPGSRINSKGGKILAQEVEKSVGIRDSSGKLVNRNGGQLNPQWVEWLMGFPIGWTDLQHLETQSFPK